MNLSDMKRILGTWMALAVFAAWPVLAQGGAQDAGGAGQGDAGALQTEAGPPTDRTAGGVRTDTDADTERQQIQEESAARTDVPPVRGAETIPTDAQPGGQAQVGQERTGVAAQPGQQAETQPGQVGTDRDVTAETEAGGVTERAALERERAPEAPGAAGAGTELEGGAMPTTSSALPLALGVGALLLGAGVALRLARGR